MGMFPTNPIETNRWDAKHCELNGIKFDFPTNPIETNRWDFGGNNH